MRCVALIWLLATGLLFQPASGQPVDQSAIPELTIRAAVWGQVNRPGHYYLNGSPDLLELLSAAGGPAPNADLGRLVLIRERDGSRKRLNLTRIVQAGQPFLITTGDVVIVPEAFWNRFQRSLPAITTAATLANVVITLILVAQR